MKKEFKRLIYEKKDGIAWLKFNLPEKLNPYGPELADEIYEALVDADKDESIGVVILTGIGRAFSAGGDLSKLGTDEWTIEEGRKFYETCLMISHLLRNMGKVTIAAVKGFCVGGGNEIALFCDITIAADNAKFGQPEVKVGATGQWGATQLLPIIVGEKIARELMLSGRIIDAQEAERIGLVNKVVPEKELDEYVENYARDILKNSSPFSVRVIKTWLNLWHDFAMISFNHTREYIALHWISDEFKEYTAAFREKREPKVEKRWPSLRNW